MNDGRRVLVVAPEYPYPPIDGHKVRIYNLFKHLPTEYTFDFICLGPQDSLDDEEVLRAKLGPACEGIEVISDNTLERISRGRFAGIRNILFPYETSIGEPFLSPVLARRIRERVYSKRYDLVHVCGLFISLHFDKTHSRTPYIVDICDCLSLLTRSCFRQERRPVAKLKKYVNYIWADRYEKVHVSKLRNIIMISDVDAKKISRNCPDSRIEVVPNGVDTDYFRPCTASKRPASALLFTGVMNYPPNNEAMLYFVKDVYPRLQACIPEVTLTIVGRNPTCELRSLAAQTSGVTVTGYVDDIRPYFDSATAYVSPLLSGAGIKNKVLEAWSMGMPVVATSVSCSGIKARNNKNILIADRSTNLIASISSLLSDKCLRERLSHEGRKTVEREYSWASRSEMLSSIFNEVIESWRLT